MAMSLTRSEMEAKLGEVFAPEQTTRPVDIFDAMRQAELERAADTRDLKRGLTELTEEVRKLTAAQQRTDERLAQTNEQLVEFQQRMDDRLARTNEQLAKFQQRTDERLAQTNEQLVEFQQRTDERFAELATAQQRTEKAVLELTVSVKLGFAELRQAVGGLGNTLGFNYSRINRERG